MSIIQNIIIHKVYYDQEITNKQGLICMEITNKQGLLCKEITNKQGLLLQIAINGCPLCFLI